MTSIDEMVSSDELEIEDKMEDMKKCVRWSSLNGSVEILINRTDIASPSRRCPIEEIPHQDLVQRPAEL